MKGIKTIYVCTSCGYESPKWLGKCPQCGAWNSFVEDAVEKLRQELMMGRDLLVRNLNKQVGAQVIVNIIFR